MNKENCALKLVDEIILRRKSDLREVNYSVSLSVTFVTLPASQSYSILAFRESHNIMGTADRRCILS